MADLYNSFKHYSGLTRDKALKIKKIVDVYNSANNEFPAEMDIRIRVFRAVHFFLRTAEGNSYLSDEPLYDVDIKGNVNTEFTESRISDARLAALPSDFKPLPVGNYRILGRSFGRLIDDKMKYDDTVSADGTQQDMVLIQQKISDASFHDGLCACCGMTRNRKDLYYVAPNDISNPSVNDVYSVGSSCIEDVSRYKPYFDMLRRIEKVIGPSRSHGPVKHKGKTTIAPDKYLASALTVVQLGLPSLGVSATDVFRRAGVGNRVFDYYTPNSYFMYEGISNTINLQIDIKNLDNWANKTYLAVEGIHRPFHMRNILAHCNFNNVYTDNLKKVRKQLASKQFISVFDKYKDSVGAHNAEVIRDTMSEFYSKDAGPVFLKAFDEFLGKTAPKYYSDAMDVSNGIPTRHLIRDFKMVASGNNVVSFQTKTKKNKYIYTDYIRRFYGETLPSETLFDAASRGYVSLPKRKFEDEYLAFDLPSARMSVPISDVLYNSYEDFFTNSLDFYDKKLFEHGRFVYPNNKCGYHIERSSDGDNYIVFNNAQKESAVMSTRRAASLFGSSPSKGELQDFCLGKKSFMIAGERLSFNVLKNRPDFFDNVPYLSKPSDYCDVNRVSLDSSSGRRLPVEVTMGGAPVSIIEGEARSKVKSDTSLCFFKGWLDKDKHDKDVLCLPIRVGSENCYLHRYDFNAVAKNVRTHFKGGKKRVEFYLPKASLLKGWYRGTSFGINAHEFVSTDMLEDYNVQFYKNAVTYMRTKQRFAQYE